MRKQREQTGSREEERDEWSAAEERKEASDRPTSPTLIPAASGAQSTNINR